MVDEAGADVDDVTGALVDHLPDRALRDVEEPTQVDGGDRVVVLDAVVRERLADVDPGVVDQRVDATEPVDSLAHHPLGSGRFDDVARDGRVIALV